MVGYDHTQNREVAEYSFRTLHCTTLHRVLLSIAPENILGVRDFIFLL